MKQETARFHELDSLRAIAAIGVIGWHYAVHFGATPMPGVLMPFYRHGYLLVDFFFVLSGFVLAHVYWTDRRSGNLWPNVRQRIARMYPLHFTTLIAVAVMQWVLTHQLARPPFIYKVNDAYDFALNLVLLNRSGLERGYSFNAPSWSISTEFIVNLVFLLAIALRPKIAKATLATLFVACLGVELKLGFMSGDRAFGIDNAVYHTMVGFLVGVAAYRIYVAMFEAKPLNAVVADIVAIGAVALFVAYMSWLDLSETRDLLVTALVFPILLVMAIQSKYVKALLRLRPLTYLGAISYSIYLVHFPLQLAIHLFSVLFDRKLPFESGYFLLAFLILTVATASLTYRFVELPGKRLLVSRVPSIKQGANQT